jgi:hypothetical protein
LSLPFAGTSSCRWRSSRSPTSASRSRLVSLAHAFVHCARLSFVATRRASCSRLRLRASNRSDDAILTLRAERCDPNVHLSFCFSTFRPCTLAASTPCFSRATASCTRAAITGVSRFGSTSNRSRMLPCPPSLCLGACVLLIVGAQFVLSSTSTIVCVAITATESCSSTKSGRSESFSRHGLYHPLLALPSVRARCQLVRRFWMTQLYVDFADMQVHAAPVRHLRAAHR